MARRIPAPEDLFGGNRYRGPGVVCGICGRPLSNPRSMDAGFGPICTGKNHQPQRGEPMPRAFYSAEIRDGAIVIVDGGEEGTPTVTNTAEQVIEDLRARGYDLTMPIVYRDSHGRWDGLAVKDGAFADFIMLGGTSHTDALEKLAARWRSA